MSAKTPKPKPLLDPDEYTIGIVCALAHEAVAVQSSFDHFFLDKKAWPKTAKGDGNSYSFGTICDYHIVLAHLADMGDVEAKEVAKDMQRSFQNIKLCFVVGICGIIPKIGKDQAVLGDVVISSEVIQYTRGKEYPSGFKSKNMLQKASDAMLRGFKQLLTPEPWEFFCHQVNVNLCSLMEHKSIKSRAFGYPGRATDFLYEADYIHEHRNRVCKDCAAKDYCQEAFDSLCDKIGCSKEELILGRPVREIVDAEAGESLKSEPSFFPRIYHGKVASGNKVMKNGAMRDRVTEEHGVIAFEMEGAGVWSTFPTVVIKAGCDYADSHKNKQWQEWAAMTAASCAKAFLGQLQMGIPENVQYITEDRVPVREPSWLDIFSWLTSKNEDLDFVPFQNDLLLQMQDGAGEWFLHTDEFTKWLTSEAGLLYCHGIRGCGKTSLMSVVVNYLQKILREQQQPSIVIYHYVQPKPAHSCDLRFAALLAQVIQYRRQSSSALKELYLRCQVSNGSQPPGRELLNILLAEVSEFGNVYIVVDGLDEMDNQTQVDFVKKVCKFGERRRGVRSLFTSYMECPQLGPLSKASLCEIKTRASDLREFISTQMEDRVSICDLIEDLSEEEKPQVKEKLLDALFEKAEGLWGFLRAQHHLELIDGTSPGTLDDLERFIQNLSPNIHHIYKGLWDQILKDDSKKALAREVLLWLACSPHNLSIQLIQHVLALSRGIEIAGGTHSLLPKKRIVASCRGLVQVGKASNNVSFNHPTVHAFVLDHLDSLGFENPHQSIAFTCLHYLDTILTHHISAAGNMDGQQQFEADILQEIMRKSPLTSYTIENFSTHAQQASNQDLLDEFNRIFGSTSRLTIIGMLYLWYFISEDDRENFKWRPVSTIHLVTAMGLQKLLEMVLKDGVSIEEEDEEGFTALHWSILSRNPMMIEKVVFNGALLTRQDKLGHTTLRWALGDDFGWMENSINDVLMTDSGQFLTSTSFRLTPRFAQAKKMWMDGIRLRTDLQCLELLINLHSEADLQEMGTQLIILAAKKQLGSIVTMLLRKGVPPPARALLEVLLGSSHIVTLSDVMLEDRSQGFMGFVIQIKESEWRHVSTKAENVFTDDQWLCQLITDETVHERGPRNRSVLSFAAERGFFNVCKELIVRGAVVDDFDLDGWSPLMWAVVSPKPEKMFIDNCLIQDRANAYIGVIVEVEGLWQPNEGVYAASGRDLQATQKADIVELFLSHGADPWARNKQGASVCDKARWDCLPGVLEVLQQYIREWTQAYYQSLPDQPPLTAEEFERGLFNLPAQGQYMRRTPNTSLQSTGHPDWPQSSPSEQYPNQAAIEAGNILAIDKSQLVFAGDKFKNIHIEDNAKALISVPADSVDLKLPKEIYKTILSLIQVRIENIMIQDRAQVMIGLSVHDSAAPVQTDALVSTFLTETNKQPES